MSSVGQQLQQARVARKLTVEDAAFKTHIPHQHLRDLENDDFTNFANPTYAKGFLKLYSRFLNVDLGDTLDDFAPSAPPGRPLQTHIQEAHPSRVLNPSRMRTSRRASRRGRNPRLPWDKIALLAFLLAAAWLIFKPAKSPPAAPPPTPQAPTPQAIPLPTPTAAPTPAPQPSAAEPEPEPEPTLAPEPEPAAAPSIPRATPVEDEAPPAR